MSRLATILVLLTAVLYPGTGFATERGAASIAPRGEIPAFSAAHALVIGVNAYEGGWARLKNAVPDAEAVAAALEQTGFDSVTLVRDPTRDRLVRALEDFVYGPGADPDARLVVWFAGHGHTIDGEGYIVPREAPLPGDTAESEAAFRRNALSMRRFGEYLREIRARHALAVFDSCFAGTVINATRSAEVPPAIREAASKAVRQIITSGEAGETVSDDGTFRRLFVDALTGADMRAAGVDGYLTGSRLGAFLAERISNYTGGRQNPVHGKLGVLNLDRGDFVFPQRHAVTAAAAPAEVAVAAAAPASARALAPELRIEAPTVAGDDADAAFVAAKTVRNLVEHLSGAGLAVSSDLTARDPARRASHVLAISVTRDGDAASVHAELSATDGAVVAATTLTAPVAFLRERYKAIPETLLFLLDVSPGTLAPLATAKPATSSGHAYLAFLAARQEVERRRPDRASALLAEAVEIDPSFAAAVAARADVEEAAGADAASVAALRQEALEIDPDHARLNVFEARQMGDPVPALRLSGIDAAWRTVGDGLEMRTLEAEDYGIAVHGWRYDPERFRLKLSTAADARGSSAAEMRLARSAALAINAGFFDFDYRSRLTPVGLHVVEGRMLQPFDAEKAKNPLTGVLYSSDGDVTIVPARDFDRQAAVEMALQAGPLVVDPGGGNGIRRNAYDRLNRSAVCRGFDGRTVIVQAAGGLSLYEFGALLSTKPEDGGFGCERAINLDGGPSSQVSMDYNGEVLEVPGLWRVSSGLVLEARPAE